MKKEKNKLTFEEKLLLARLQNKKICNEEHIFLAKLAGNYKTYQSTYTCYYELFKEIIRKRVQMGYSKTVLPPWRLETTFPEDFIREFNTFQLSRRNYNCFIENFELLNFPRGFPTPERIYPVFTQIVSGQNSGENYDFPNGTLCHIFIPTIHFYFAILSNSNKEKTSPPHQVVRKDLNYFLKHFTDKKMFLSGTDYFTYSSELFANISVFYGKYDYYTNREVK